jgi:hypothetical protein
MECKPVETRRDGRSVEDGDQLHTSRTLIIRRCLVLNRTASVNITANLQEDDGCPEALIVSFSVVSGPAADQRLFILCPTFVFWLLVIAPSSASPWGATGRSTPPSQRRGDCDQ